MWRWMELKSQAIFNINGRRGTSVCVRGGAKRAITSHGRGHLYLPTLEFVNRVQDRYTCSISGRQDLTTIALVEMVAKS